MNAPAHVPAELIYEFDYLTDTALLTDPHQRFAELGALRTVLRGSQDP